MTHLAGRFVTSTRARVLGILVLALAGTAQIGVAQTALPERGTQSDQEACTPDVFRLCSDLIPDEPRILACLKSKLTQLSPACGKVLAPDDKPHRRRRAASPIRYQ